MCARNVAGTTPLNHVIVACQENRAFDHYFGYYPQAGPYGVPPAYAQPDGHGGLVQPHHLESPITGDTAHDWGAIHSEWTNIPTLVVSPYARPGHISPTFYDHGSILKLVEAVFGLPTLASINHQFDQQTPAANNDAAAPGAVYGPPAPPRDGNPATGNLLDVFDFEQAPRAASILPPIAAAGQPGPETAQTILQAVRNA